MNPPIQPDQHGDQLALDHHSNPTAYKRTYMASLERYQKQPMSELQPSPRADLTEGRKSDRAYLEDIMKEIRENKKEIREMREEIKAVSTLFTNFTQSVGKSFSDLNKKIDENDTMMRNNFEHLDKNLSRGPDSIQDVVNWPIMPTNSSMCPNSFTSLTFDTHQGLSRNNHSITTRRRQPSQGEAMRGFQLDEDNAIIYEGIYIWFLNGPSSVHPSDVPQSSLQATVNLISNKGGQLRNPSRRCLNCRARRITNGNQTYSNTDFHCCDNCLETGDVCVFKIDRGWCVRSIYGQDRVWAHSHREMDLSIEQLGGLGGY